MIDTKSQPFLVRCFLLYEMDIDIVLLQETWLDASVESFSLPGYVELSRRDRSAEDNRGGIITLCRKDVKISLRSNMIVVCGTSSATAPMIYELYSSRSTVKDPDERGVKNTRRANVAASRLQRRVQQCDDMAIDRPVSLVQKSVAKG